MRAAIVESGSVIVKERPDPVPGAGELLVQVQAAGLNGADILQRAGGYAAPPGSPADIPGLELAGVVAAIGPGVWRFAVGDRVMAVVGGGAQAELAIVHERTALPVPEALSPVEAGGFPEAFTVSHDALFTQCGLGSGEHVLVNGAAGGVGIAGVQLALLAGASVVASVRNAALRDAVAAFGATVVDPAEAPEHGPYDVILELSRPTWIHLPPAAALRSSASAPADVAR
jgi:NADPH:quinone reductase-like Zn-dependent oxidoreductase